MKGLSNQGSTYQLREETVIVFGTSLQSAALTALSLHISLFQVTNSWEKLIALSQGDCPWGNYLQQWFLKCGAPDLQHQYHLRTCYKCKCLGPIHRPTGKETAGLGPTNLCFKKSSRWFRTTWKFLNHSSVEKMTRSCGLNMVTEDLSLCVWVSSQRGKRVMNLAATPRGVE